MLYTNMISMISIWSIDERWVNVTQIEGKVQTEQCAARTHEDELTQEKPCERYQQLHRELLQQSDKSQNGRVAPFDRTC